MCVADGKEYRYSLRHPEIVLHHGSTLQVGDVILQVRLYEGLEASARLMPVVPVAPQPVYPEDAAAAPVTQELPRRVPEGFIPQEAIQAMPIVPNNGAVGRRMPVQPQRMPQQPPMPVRRGPAQPVAPAEPPA